jgi:hypothetical protein
MAQKKRDFYVVMDELIEHNKQFNPTAPYIITRQVLKPWCDSTNTTMPQSIWNNKVKDEKGNETRATFDLRPLQKASTNVYGGKTVEEQEEREPMTDEELLDDINSRFASLDLLTYGVINGDFHSLIVSGNPGIGKTYTLEYILESARDEAKIEFESVRGYVRATGLYRLLYQYREEGQVIMFDDADSVFSDENGLNLLKSALDTTKRRTINWRSEKQFEADDGEKLPNSFDFKGSVIFVSNIDFERASRGGSKLAPHMEALMSRSYYLNLNLVGSRELLVRIRNVVENSSILSSMDLAKRDQKRVVEYIENNVNKLRELSLRTVIKLGTIMRAAAGDVTNFTKMADATSLKRLS